MIYNDIYYLNDKLKTITEQSQNFKILSFEKKTH